MNKKTKRLLLNLGFVAVLLIITLVVLFVNQKELNFGKILEYFKDSNPVWIVCAFICMLLFIAFEGLSLFFIERIFGKRIKITSAMAYSSADTFYSAITPSATGGQPAAVYYMARDGMSAGKASFAMLFNVICYTASIFVIGIIALCINPAMFSGVDTVFSKILIISGGVIQAFLLGLFIGCMFFGKAIIKLGKWFVKVLYKIKIVKNIDRWNTKIEEEVGKYSACLKILSSKPLVIFTTLLFNILQRVSQTLIPCFVCLAIDPNAPFMDIFVLQSLVLFGYNAIPIPGGVGAYEYLFINVYTQMYSPEFILLALMISRLFSYYFSMLVSGVYTLTYHIVKVPKVAEGDGGDGTAEDSEHPGEESPPDSPDEAGESSDGETADAAEDNGGEESRPEERV